MTQAAEDLLVLPAVRGTVFEKVQELERQVTAAQLDDLEISALDTVTEDLGLIEDGEYRAGNDRAPGDGFTGVRIGGPFSYLDHNWHIVGLYMDILKFALSAEDGAAYAAGGNLRIDESGLHMLALDYPIDFTAENNDLTRTAIMRMHALTETAAPRFEIVHTSPGEGENLITNGGFETGDLTGWTVVSGSWEANEEAPQSGTYCVDGTTNQNAELTSDRIAVTAGKKYAFTGYLTNTNGEFESAWVRIQFFDAASGGSTTGSTNIYVLDGTPTVFAAPADSESCEVEIHLKMTWPVGGSACLDDLVLQEAGGTTVLALDASLHLESSEAFEIEELSDDPSTPDSGYRGLYAKEGGFYEVDDAGDVRMLSRPVLSGPQVVFFPGADWADDVNDNYRTAVAADRDIRAIRFFLAEPVAVRYLTVDRGLATGGFAAAIVDADDAVQMEWWDWSYTTGINRVSCYGAQEVVLAPGFYWFAWGCYDDADTFRSFQFFSRPSFVPILNDTVAHFGDSSYQLPASAPYSFPGVGTVTALSTLHYFPIGKVEGV